MYNLQGDPTSLEEALSPPDLGFWKEGINDEMDSIISNNSWKLVDLPPASIRLDTHLCVHVCTFYSSSSFFLTRVSGANNTVMITVHEQ